MHHNLSISYLDESRKDEIDRFLDEWNNDQDHIEAQTSGSTGEPKKILLRKDHMIRSARSTIEFFNLQENQLIYLPLSTSTIAGKMMILRSIVGNLKLLIGPVSSNSLCLITQKIDFAVVTPIQLEYLINNCCDHSRHIETVLTGGAPLSSSLIEKIRKLEMSVYQSYGMTETMSHVALRKIGESDSFTALKNVSFSETENNELVIHAPDMGIESLKTYDVIKLHSPLSFDWIGRSDFTINSGGIKLQPEFIEKQLQNLIHFPFFITSIPDESLGEKAILAVENSNGPNLNKDDLKKYLSKYEVPKEIYYFEKFKYTTSQKIDRIKTMQQPYVLKKVL